MLDTLSLIGKSLNEMEISWAVGGSLLLNFHQLVDKPNDIDLLVDEQYAADLNQTISKIGKEKVARHMEPFKTRYFSKYRIGHVDIDIMGGFAIQHGEGVFKLPFNKDSVVAHKNINGLDIPLCSLEDWYILYWLIPGKQEKAVLIENYFKNKGVQHPQFLENAMQQPLPVELKERVESLLK